MNNERLVNKSVLGKKTLAKLKSGTTKDFFDSARETAREIDEGKKVTEKDIIRIGEDA